MTLARWYKLMTLWQMPESIVEYSKLYSAYSEAHRHYHNRNHVKDCLSLLDKVSDLADSPEELELALWYHDVIYKPKSLENERNSADWAIRFLASNGVNSDRCERVHRFIMATLHTGESLSGDAALLVDIDVSILGKNPEEYDVYEDAIRKEYRWVPMPIYRRKRIAVLSSFLKRPSLYTTDYFQERYEPQARLNLQRAIKTLKQ